MRSIRTSGLTALASAAALVLAAIPAGGLVSGTTAAAPSTGVQAATVDPAAQLTLSTTLVTGTVSWKDKTQQFTGGSQCLITPVEGSADLLKLTGSVAAGQEALAGFRDGAIGVFESTDTDATTSSPNNAAQCARVDAGSFTDLEILTLQLGSEVVTEEEALVAESAVLDIVIRSRTLEIKTEYLQGGKSVKTTTTGPLLRQKPNSPLTLRSPNFPALTGFDTVRLTAVQGSFSLTGATFTLTQGADGDFDCEQTVSLAGNGLDPEVTVTRLGNADPDETCTVVPYRLRNGDQTVQLLKPLDIQESAQFILDFVWTVSPANTSGDGSGALLPETTIDYEVGDLGEIDLRWCPDVMTDGDGRPTGIVDVLDNDEVTDQVPEEVLEGIQFTCIVSQDATVENGDPDFVTVKQTVYLLGDAAYRFK